MTEEDHIVVIGGGLAGLSAAHAVRRAGLPVLLLESSGRVGGRIRTLRQGPWLAESGPHLFGGMPAEALAQFEELGIERCEPAPGADRRFLVHEGRVVAVPGSTTEMLGTPLLSVPGRLRLLREPFVPRGGVPDESVAGFVRRRMGTEFSRQFIEPVIAAAHGGDPSELLARYAFAESVGYEARAGSILKGRMRASRTARREGRRAIAPWTCRGGSEELVRTLAAGLGEAVRLHTGVTRIAPRAGGRGWAVTTGAGSILHARGVVIALSARTVGTGLVDGMANGVSLASLASIPHAATRAISLGFRRAEVEHPLDGHGVVGPVDGSAGFRSVVFASSLFPERAPPDHVLLTVQLGGTRAPAVAELAQADLVTALQAPLAALLGVRGSPEVVLGHDQPDLLPLPVAGHEERLAAADAAEAASVGLAFCGSWRDGVGEGGIVRGGSAAVERMLRSLAGRS